MRPTLAIAALAALTASLGAQAPSSTDRDTIPGTLVTFEMVPVPRGTVTIDGKAITVEPFHIGRTEVTWDMYDVFALGLDTPKDQAADAVSRPSRPYGAPDYGWGHSGYAAISIARPAAEAFCEWLSKKTGRAYRLPTEAEWAHAAALAVGSVPLAADRRDNLAWHGGNALGKAHAVARKKPDALGLFDLFGNAAEWVMPADGALVTRGGSFRDPP